MRPRIRTIKPEMFADERIVALSREARLLLLGLVTMADDEGRFRARRSAILGHVYPGDDDAVRKVDGWIGEIREQGLVLFYVADGTPYGAFRHWRRHQKINKPTGSDLPSPPDPVVVRDNSVPTKGDGTELAGNGHSPTRTRALRSDPSPEVVQRLCLRLADHVRRNDPKADPKPESDRWLTDMRLLVGDRTGDVAEVERILDWCQGDSFWRSNILSPGKLRQQFTQLVLKASPRGEVVPLRRESPSDLLRAINGEAS